MRTRTTLSLLGPSTLWLLLSACGQTPTAAVPSAAAPRTGAPTTRALTVQTLQAAQVTAWGDNYYGQRNIPAGLTGVTAIAAGRYHNLGLKSDGTVVGWGLNDYGQTTIPAGLTNVTAISAGAFHSLALKSDGSVVGWGDNGFGQATSPAGLTGVTAIAAGTFHSLALKSDGTVVAWGFNNYGQTTIPAGLKGVTAIAAGAYHNLVLKNDGTVVAWGDNEKGQTTIPAGLTDVTAIAAGQYHSLALKSDGTVVAWGDNYSGQTTIPAGLKGVTAIAAGQYHSLALKSDGSVVGWGDNYYGQATSPAGLTGVTAIAAGGRHSLALFTPTDSTPPVITATPSPATPNGAGGWYTTPVTVSWSVTDSESAVSSSSGCDSTTISSDTTGQTLTCTATSGGGTASSPVTIKLDVVKPTLSPVLSSSVPVLLGASLSATPNATDATSGVATATCGPAETSSVGSKTLTCTATDVAGNTATTAVPYSVIYNFHGFTKSLANFPLLNTARTGSAVPINFDLGGVTSLDVLAAGYPKVTPVGCATTAAVPENATSFSAASVAGLTYSATTGTYSYVWKTGSTPGCYQFNLKLRDGTNHYALVKLR